MGEHYISAIEEYCHDQAGVVPDDSDRWLFIHLLDELTTGFLSQRTLKGHLADPDDILNHYFWVLGVMEHTAYYSAFAQSIDPVPVETRAWMKGRIREMIGHSAPIERAGDIMQLFERKTISAISFGHDGNGWNTIILYWNPFFTADISLGFLTETVSFDDGL